MLLLLFLKSRNEGLFLFWRWSRKVLYFTGDRYNMTEDKEKIIARLYCKLKHELRVYAARFCPEEAEDIVHQAFVNGYERILAERDESEQRSYLYSTVKNLCLNFLRNAHPVYTETPPELMTEFVVVDTHDYMHELIDRLPRRERTILELALQGYSTKEIAEKIEMEYNTVRHYKKEAYTKIRQALKNEI